MFNGGNECGTGAVVPWAGRLWGVTCSPLLPLASGDKLYEIDAQLDRTIRHIRPAGTSVPEAEDCGA